MKLYVGCALMHADDTFLNQVVDLKNKLRSDYEVLEFLGLDAGSDEDVYRWDIEGCVATCDAFLAICDYPSIGLGWELSEAIRREIPVVGVAHQEATVSRLLRGAAEMKPNFTLDRYDDLVAEAPSILLQRLSTV